MNECTPQQVRDWLAAGLGDVEVLQVEGDGRHFRALIVASIFEGLSRVRRHQLVYSAIKGRMDEDIHALSLQLLSPGEYHAQT